MDSFQNRDFLDQGQGRRLKKKFRNGFKRRRNGYKRRQEITYKLLIYIDNSDGFQ
jgi:hypothetical protein